MSERTLTFNGVNGDDGSYGIEPIDGKEFAKRVTGLDAPPGSRVSGVTRDDELRARSYRQRGRALSVGFDLDPMRLDEVGWGVIFPEKADWEVVKALRPLLDLRRGQAEDRFKIFHGAHGYHPGETKNEFLIANKVGPGLVYPDRVPYYLLLVGNLDEIPFEFQRSLDVEYAVGRIGFETLEEYGNYAANVVAAEQGKIRRDRHAAFFGVTHEEDMHTRLATDMLIRPLLEQIRIKAKHLDWRVSASLHSAATQSRLTRLLSGRDAPSLLVAAAHGLEFAPGSPHRRARQGALLCADWPGPEEWRSQNSPPIPEGCYFSADDVPPNADLSGLIALLYGSFSAGVLSQAELPGRAAGRGAPVASSSFLASLPVHLLGRRCGALAVIGMTGRAWGYSGEWQDMGATTAAYQSALERLLEGVPVGMAIEYVDERYAEAATQLAQEMEYLRYGKSSDLISLGSLWLAMHDAQNRVILGDPAVRLGGRRSP